ncbi:class A beta-lactamase [Dyella sp. A6]|uniref:class A beta-lactamase n=1 Tax=Dyella aluminiiresistens TaxID=3069105 RepID=UPI002E7727FA|nr:class A beta-lactamase [Dyella sp. A6]
MRRRDLMKSALLGAAAWTVRPSLALAGVAGTIATPAELERRYGGRLGVAVLDTGTGRRLRHRADQRFMMCSTGKLLVVGAVLAKVDRGQERLDRRIVFGRDAVLDWAPITRMHAGAPGMTIAQLCHAALTVSDNTAMNLLLDSLGGPAAATRYVRGLGDPLTRFDRYEPELNVPAPGGLLDTSTPDAMLADMQALLLGDVLSASSRARLTDWMRHNTTGMDQLRAGLPMGWTAGDKTGSSRSQTNDVAIIWPPGRKPLLVVAFYEGPTGLTSRRKAVLAQVGTLASRV